MKNKSAYVVGVIFLLTIVFCAPYILPFNRIVVEESYLQQCSYLDVNLIPITQSKGIPFWSYHFGGGYPFIKHPENTVLSPLFYLLVLPFGSANGMKVMLLFYYMIGCGGFFLFARRILKFERPAASLSTIFFVLNSFVPFQVNTGNTRDPGWLFLPLVAYLFLRARESGKYIIFCAGITTLVLLNGFNLYMVPLFLFLLVFSLIKDAGAPEGTMKAMALTGRTFIFLGACTFLLGAIKIFPLLELLRENARGIDDYAIASSGAMTAGKMFLAFFSRGPYAVGNEAVMGANGLGMGSVMYFGVIPAMFFAFSCVFCFKKVWKYLAAMGIFLLLAMANNSPADLFYPLWHLPLFHSMREVARYFSFPAVFMAALIMGASLSSEMFRRLNKKLRIAIYIIAAIAAVNMFAANTQYFRFAGRYQEEIPALTGEGDFFNVSGVLLNNIEQAPFYRKNRAWTGKYAVELGPGLQYYLLRQNVGLINWFGNIPLDENAAPKYGVTIGYGDYWKDLRSDITRSNGIAANRGYKGEGYFEKDSSNKVKSMEWSSNRIIVDVEQAQPDNLIINQNYDKEWGSPNGRVYDAGGLLGLELSGAGTEKVELIYRPGALYAGAAVSLITLLAAIMFLMIPWMKRKKGRE
ncbi:MAG: hypothetical protein P9L88_00745 [Candidatus Tantalella remota]|nr:hypothetical protein [Candidatus Tantalella remota]